MYCGYTGAAGAQLYSGVGTFNEVSGCLPGDDTQALLITRGGSIAGNGPTWLAYLNSGGRIITAWNTAVAVYNEIHGTAYPRGPWFGNCHDNAMPEVKLNPSDPFWVENPIPVTPSDETGCGYGLDNLISAEPHVIALGSVEGRVSFAAGPGAVGWLFLLEADWQDGEGYFTDGSRQFMGALISACPQCDHHGIVENGTRCNDGDSCTMIDTCQDGVCTGADPIDCDDDNPCTADTCDTMGGCVHDDAPASGCLTSEKSMMLIKNDASDDTRDKLLWKWIKGAGLTQMDLGDPTGSTGYALCIYAGSTNALIADAALPPGTDWSAIGEIGYKFKGTSPDGLALARIKGGDPGKSKALAKGKGATLPDPVLPVAYPVTAQLRRDGSPLCLESTFTSANEKRNDERLFKAKQ